MNEQHQNWSLADWEREHRALAAQVFELERRAILTPGEQVKMSELKKRKLVAKDRMFELKRVS